MFKILKCLFEREWGFVCMDVHRLEVSTEFLPQSWCTLFSETGSLTDSATLGPAGS